MNLLIFNIKKKSILIAFTQSHFEQYFSYIKAIRFFWCRKPESMLNRAIFIRPDSEFIGESVYACAKLFVDEESTWHKSNRGI
jgi:hypothetical protein